MKRLPLGPLYYEFSRHNEPRLRIAPGETVLVVVRQKTPFRVRSAPTPIGEIRPRNLTATHKPGPIWIEGAEPGDALAVKIEEIRPSLDQCATRTSDPRQLAEWLGDDCPHGVHVCPIRDGQIYWSDDITIPLHPDARLYRNGTGYRCADNRTGALTVVIWISSKPVPAIPFTCPYLYQVGISIWAMHTLQWDTANFPLLDWKCLLRQRLLSI